MYSSLRSGTIQSLNLLTPNFMTIYLYAIPAEQQFKINKFEDIQQE